MSKTHTLKTWPVPFQAVLDGTKRYEIRANDRGYSVGDALELLEYEPDQPMGSRYTGRETRVTVTYITRGGEWGLPANLCVMSIETCEVQP